MRWRSLCCPLLTAGLVSPHAGAQATQRRPLTKPDVERFVDSAFAGYVKESAQPSLAVVVMRGDTVLLAKGYGFERGSVPVSPDSTLFHIASVSKLFVATAIMQLVEQGRMRLDDPVSSWLPELAVPAEVTVRHLVTHTSGIDAPFQAAVVDDAGNLRALGAYFAEHTPRFGRPPGAEIRYSNQGMSLAALVVEKVSGMQFDDYVEQQIFTPLGMQRSSIRQPPPRELDGRVATAGTARVPDYLLLYPAGAVVSTPSDMGRFMSMLLSDGTTDHKTFLSASSVAAMQRRQWSARPDIPGVALGFFESDLGGARALFHTGARVHFSLLYLVPSQRVGVFIVHSMRQGGPFQNMRTRFVREFVQRYVGELVETNQARSLSSRMFAGVYRPVLFSTTTIERAAALLSDTRVVANADGSIDVHVPLGGRMRAEPQGAAVFRVREGDQAGLTIAFSDSSVASRRMFLSGATQDPVSFDRLQWYQRGLLHLILIAIALAIVASYSCTVLVMAIWRRLGGKRGRPVNGTHLPQLMLVASIAMLLAPVAAVATLLGGGGSAGPQKAVGVGVTLLFSASVVALASVPVAIAAPDRAQWNSARRVHRWLFAISSVTIFGLALYYHLGPFWL
jgi:CubicO group peptidase (beta-lactamase class C family)